MKNRDVVRGWIAQNRAIRTTHLFYQGAILYSYGTHWPLAGLYVSPSGDRYAIVNVTSNSVSTNHHRALVTQALDNERILWVGVFTDDWSPTRKQSAALIYSALDRQGASLVLNVIQRRMTPSVGWRRLLAVYSQMTRFQQLTGLRRSLRFFVSKDDMMQYVNKRRQALKRKDDRRMRKDARNARRWHAGLSDLWPWSYPVGLRWDKVLCVIEVGSRYEQFSFHLETARRMLQILRATRRSPGDPARLLTYTVNYFAEEDYFRIGCQKLMWSEVIQVAQAAGIPIESSDVAPAASNC
jgi:hypothetical protein